MMPLANIFYRLYAHTHCSEAAALKLYLMENSIFL